MVRAKRAILAAARESEDRDKEPLAGAGRVRVGLCTRLADGKILCHAVYDEYADDEDRVAMAFYRAADDGGAVTGPLDGEYMVGKLSILGDPLAGEPQPGSLRAAVSRFVNRFAKPS